MHKSCFLILWLSVALCGAADESWKLISRGDAVARVSGNGAVHLETRDSESSIRASRDLQVPDDAQEIRVQVDWRPEQGGKAANIFALSAADANFAILKLRTVSVAIESPIPPAGARWPLPGTATRSDIGIGSS